MQYLALVLFTVLCAVGAFRPVWAMALLLVMFAIEVSLQGTVNLFRTYSFLANLLVALMVGMATLVALLRQPRPFVGHFTTPSLWILLAILGWSILSLTWSPALPLTPNQGSNLVVIGAPYFVIFVLMAPLLVGSISDWRRVTILMLIVGSLVSLSIVFNPEFSVRSGRISTAYEGAQRTSPLSIAQVGGMLAIFGALSTGGRTTGLLTAIRIGAFIFGAMLALFSGTRGQVVFAGAVIALLLPVSRPLKNLGSYISLVGGVAVIAVAGYLTFDFVLGQSDIDRWQFHQFADATAARTANMVELLEAFSQSVSAWGIGLGYNAFSAISGADQGYVHNMYLEVLCELGIPMFVLLVILFVRTGFAAVALFRRYREHPAERSAVSILIGMWIFQALIAGKEANLWSAWLLFLYMLLITRIETRARKLGDPLLETDEETSEVIEEIGEDDPVEEAPVRVGQPA